MITSLNGLTMNNLKPEECEWIGEQIAQWPGGETRIEKTAKAWAAANASFTTEIDANTGFIVTRIGKDASGDLVCWSRVQVTDRHAFVLNHWVAPEHRQGGVYRNMADLDQHLFFDVLGLDGAMFIVPDWSDVLAMEIEKRGYTVFSTDPQGRRVCGYTKEHYQRALKPKIGKVTTHE